MCRREGGNDIRIGDLASMIPNAKCPDFSIAPPRESIVEIHPTSSLEHL